MLGLGDRPRSSGSISAINPTNTLSVETKTDSKDNGGKFSEPITAVVAAGRTIAHVLEVGVSDTTSIGRIIFDVRSVSNLSSTVLSHSVFPTKVLYKY